MKHWRNEIPRNASKFSIVKKLYLNSKEETAFALLQMQLKLRIGDSPIEHFIFYWQYLLKQAILWLKSVVQQGS